MRVIECDRCHKRIRDAVKIGHISLDTQDVKTGDIDGKNEFEGWDICDDCMQKIRDFMHMRLDKPKATIKRSPVQGTTITKPDWIRRLAGEGKTIKEICEITGCSEPTARKYKAEVANETTEPIAEGDQED